MTDLILSVEETDGTPTLVLAAGPLVEVEGKMAEAVMKGDEIVLQYTPEAALALAAALVTAADYAASQPST